MVGHLVADTVAAQLRKAIKSQVLSGQRSTHFSKESDSRRKYLLRQFRKLGCVSIFVVIRNHSTRASRQIAISTLLAVSGEFDIHTLIFDLDETTYLADRELIRRYNEPRIPNFVHFDFKRRNEEPLLWVADGVAWALNRGGDWLTRIDALKLESPP